MGLSIQIAAPKDSAEQASAVDFNEVIHCQIFDRGLLREGEYPLLQRMSNPFEDVRYSTDELPPLVVEMSELARRVNPMIAAQLTSISKVAEQAHQAGYGMLALAD